MSIDVKHTTKVFDGQAALNDVSLNIPSGQILDQTFNLYIPSGQIMKNMFSGKHIFFEQVGSQGAQRELWESESRI